MLRIRSNVALKGKELVPAVGENSNPLFSKTSVKSPLISKEAVPAKVEDVREIYEYDLITEPGRKYHLKRK